MTITIRTAKKDDQGDHINCLYSAGPDMYDYMFQTDKYSAKDFLAYEFLSGRGYANFNNVTVAIDEEGKVVGTICFYDGSQANRLSIGTAINALKFYGPLTGIA